MSQDKDLQQIATEAREFRERFETLLISTSNNDGLPEASYAGFSSHLLARKRLSYSCEVSEIDRQTPGFDAIMDKLT